MCFLLQRYQLRPASPPGAGHEAWPSRQLVLAAKTQSVHWSSWYCQTNNDRIARYLNSNCNLCQPAHVCQWYPMRSACLQAEQMMNWMIKHRWIRTLSPSGRVELCFSCASSVLCFSASCWVTVRICCWSCCWNWAWACCPQASQFLT